MAGALSSEVAKRLEEAQFADLSVDLATAERVGVDLFEWLCATPKRFDVIVGVGSVGCQLVNALSFAAASRTGVALDWRLAPLDKNGMARLHGSIDRGSVLLVSAAPVPGEQLSWVVGDARAEHATVSDMLVVSGHESAYEYSNAARQLGVSIHPLSYGE